MARSPPSITLGVIACIAVIFLTAHRYRNEITPTFSSIPSNKQANKHPALTNQFNLPETDKNTSWPHMIWQSAKYAAQNQSDEETRLARTWADLNPDYRHEMMTHERVQGYCLDNFHNTNPQLEDLYLETHDYMLRTDVLRYLVLLKDGGIYNDLDVECLEPIDTWIPEEYCDRAGVVLGIEADHDQEEGAPHRWQLVVWTMMAKPNQPFIRFVLDRLIEDMANVSAEEQAALTIPAILGLTGPAATTVDFLEYAALVTGMSVTQANFSGLTEPVLVGEVLVLPIWSFGSEGQVAKSGLWGKQREMEGKGLVRHHFANSWKQDHHEERRE